MILNILRKKILQSSKHGCKEKYGLDKGVLVYRETIHQANSGGTNSKLPWEW